MHDPYKHLKGKLLVLNQLQEDFFFKEMLVLLGKVADLQLL